MSVPTWSQQIDNMFTSTWAYRKGAAIEQAYLKTPFIFWLKESGRIKEIKGHTRIEIPLEYGKNETGAWIGKGGTMGISDHELLTMAYEDWKYLAVSLVRYGTEDQKNRGAAKIIDYVERKINAAEREVYDKLEAAVFADGTGTNEPNGLLNLVADAPTTGTVHGLNRATYDWWRNLTKTASGAASTYLISDMRNMLNTMTKYVKGDISKIFMLTTQEVFEAYEDYMLDFKRIVNEKVADAGFDTVNFKGRPIMWAASCPANKMYFLNPENLYLVIDPDYFMDMTDWKAIPDQVNDKVSQIICTLQMCTNRPVAEGVLHTIQL